MNEQTIKKINLFNIEEIILAKTEIDQYLIDSGKIEKKTTLEEFITNYITPKYVYIYNRIDSVPFGMFKYGNTIYITFTYNNNQTKKLTDILLSLLSSLKYDMNNLREVNNQYIIENDNIEHLFAIGNKFYII